jgi:hypothetical protein
MNQETNPTDMLSANDVARMLGCTSRAVRNWANEKRFPGARMEFDGRVMAWVIPRQAVEDFLREKGTGPQP